MYAEQQHMNPQRTQNGCTNSCNILQAVDRYVLQGIYHLMPAWCTTHGQHRTSPVPAVAHVTVSVQQLLMVVLPVKSKQKLLTEPKAPAGGCASARM